MAFFFQGSVRVLVSSPHPGFPALCPNLFRIELLVTRLGSKVMVHSLFLVPEYSSLAHSRLVSSQILEPELLVSQPLPQHSSHTLLRSQCLPSL